MTLRIHFNKTKAEAIKMDISLKNRFIILAHQEMKQAKQRRPSVNELNKYFIECNGPWKGYDPTTHWCGIFATYLLRKAGANVKWVMSRGIHNQTGDENSTGEIHTKYYEGNNGIMVGDICVRGKGQHHFIIIGPPDESGVFEHCIEGNYGGVTNPLLHQGKRHKNNKNVVNYYYRIL